MPAKKTLSLILVAVGAPATLAAVAIAADPANGTISKAIPKVTWAGSTVSSVGVHHAYHTAGNDEVPCEQPTCDTFALKVADTAPEMTVAVDAGDSDAANIGVRVTMPDGSYQKASGAAAPGKPLKLKIKNPPVGDYVVDYTNYYVDGPVEYAGYAELLVPASAPPATTPPASTPPSSAPPATNEGFTISAKAPKVSARKAKKKGFAVAVKTSRAVEQVVVTLRKGSKTIATGKLAPFPGSGKVTVKAKKLKAGSYTLHVEGIDKGVRAARTLKLKVKR